MIGGIRLANRLVGLLKSKRQLLAADGRQMDAKWRRLRHNNRLVTPVSAAIDGPVDEQARLIEEYLTQRHFSDEVMTVDNFRDLTATREDERLVESILSEYEYEKYTTGEVPRKIDRHAMRDMMEMNNKYKTNKYIRHMFMREVTQFNNKRIKRLTMEQRELNRPAKDGQVGDLFHDDGRPIYGLWRNNLNLRINRQKMESVSLSKLRQAALFGPNLVFDFSYEQQMNLIEQKSLVMQLIKAHAANRRSRLPFNLHVCNYWPVGQQARHVERLMPHFHRPGTFINIHEKSYLDVFDKDKLVYLSPDGRKSLETLDADDVYIIGGQVDKSSDRKSSLSKAKRDGIRTASLPIDKYVLWRAGSKSLSINLVVDILCRIRNGDRWSTALVEALPDNRLKTAEDIEVEYQTRRQILNKRMKWKL